MKVTGRMVTKHPDKIEHFSRWYERDETAHLWECRNFEAESDFSYGYELRESFDNGRTFGPWRPAPPTSETFGEDELTHWDSIPDRYDRVSGNMVTCELERLFIGGHRKAYRNMWDKGKRAYTEHCYLKYVLPDGRVKRQLIAYEDGEPFDPAEPRKEAYFCRNGAYFAKVSFAENGELLIPLSAALPWCIRQLGLEEKDVFPHCAELFPGLILVRGRWVPEREAYDFSFSKPVILTSKQSSRGIVETTAAELKSGRILVVGRGSNQKYEDWQSDIEPGTPPVKWYTFSDDGGRTFAPFAPWHFDTGEVAYASATISFLFRSSKDGKLYWLGNLTDPAITVGNYPRFPLYICRVDDTFGHLLKNTLTVIDNVREGETDLLQLSNFNLTENRETGNLEVRLYKIGMHAPTWEEFTWESESWVYEIEF